MYHEVHGVQVKLVHVWRDLVLHRGVPVCEFHAVQVELIHVWRGPCNVQMSCTIRSTLYRLNLSMSGGALYCIEGS